VKFSWLPNGSGGFWPLLPVGFKRNGKILPANPSLLIDTGADGTILNLGLAGLFGFRKADLEEVKGTVVGGQTAIYVPRTPGLLEIQLGRSWHSLPSLAFTATPVSLLGRDVIFSQFELYMTSTTFELIPTSPRRGPGRQTPPVR
jgi:hypothetical protein